MILKRAIKGILLSLVFVLILAAFLGLMMDISKNKNLFLGSLADSGAPEQKTDSNLKTDSPYRNWQVADLELASMAAISAESNSLEGNKVLFSKNSSSKLPIASLTKLMTAVISIENYTLTQKIKVSSKAISVSPERNPLTAESEMSVNDLLYVMLIESNNQAAQCLSEGMGHDKFVALMNEKAQILGMKDTFFSGVTGLSPNNVSTARDLMQLAKYILVNHPEISDISRNKDYDLPGFGKLTNTDELLGEIPDIVASKTGFTLSAKGCLFLVANNPKKDGYIIYIILGADDRFSEMKKMIQWTNSAYTW